MSQTRGRESIVDWVKETCERYSDSAAAIDGDETLTFGELWDRSVQLAGELAAKGVETETLVGLWAEQCSELLIGMIGIMAAGAAYVPLDPSYPKDRLQLIAADAGLSIVVAPDRLGAAASELGIPVISTTPNSTIGRSASSLPEVKESNAAYVIFTSGSTGRPKGVVIEHHSVVDLLQWMITDCGLRPGDRIMGTASPNFDASVPNLLLPLVTGGTFIALSVETTKDPRALADAVARYHPRALEASPTMLRMLTEIGWEGDKDLEIWTGSERTAASVISYLAPRVRALCNYYGPTEATVQVTVARLRPDDIDSPVGRARDHVNCELLDPNGRPTAAGETGELFITGTALARGYLNDPALTAERFAPIAIGTGLPMRAYRTGDLARIRGDGSLVILGRVDDQIKLRGYRIEPREIEQRLMEHPQIIDAVVLSHQRNEMDEARLVAFVKSRGEVEAQSTRAFVKETLPAYMVPAVFVRIGEFPLTPSGKVDKKQLVDLAATSDNQPLTEIKSQSSDRPTTELEESLFDLFTTALDINATAIGVDDDFFDLGGTSMRCVRLLMSIEERYGVTLPPSTLVAAPTVRLLAAVVSGQLPNEPSQSDVAELPIEWEWVLSILWSEVLGVRDIKPSDNFFDLGGRSQDAVRMIEQMKTIYGIKAALSELHKAPTIREFAALTEGRSTRSSLVPLNTTGSGTPFFCIAGPGGLAMAFLPLARQLGPDQPFYGLQAHGIERRGLPDFSLNQAASRFVKVIRHVQPHGPYLIGGHSLGGALALKVVQRLAADGENVALLAIFDTILTQRMTGLNSHGFDNTAPRRRRWLRVPRLPGQFSNWARLPLTGLVRQPGIKQFELFSLHGTIQALLAGPLQPWPSFTVVYASNGDQSADVKAGWERLLTGPLTWVSVAGDHSGILQRPHVTELATHLQGQIAKALTSTKVATSDARELTTLDEGDVSEADRH